MSLRLKILFGALLALIVVVVASALMLRSRSEKSVQTSEVSSLVPSQTLPIVPASIPDSTNPNHVPNPGTNSPTSAQPTTSPSEILSSKGATNRFFSASSIADIPAGASEQLTREILAQTARLVAERFGTFSSQNGFQNLRDLQPFMTASLSAWLDGYIRQLGQSRSTATYTSTATLALRATVKEFDTDAGRATVAIDTSRTEVLGVKKTTSAHGFEVKFSREDSVWKIDNLRWLR